MPLPALAAAAIPVGASIISNMLAHATSKSPKLKKLQRYEPNQLAAKNQALQRGLDILQNPTAGFQPIADFANNFYQNKIVPGLAERFNGSGSLPSSPSFIGQLRGSGQDMRDSLAAQAAQYGQQQQNFGLNLLNTGLTPQFSYMEQPGGPTALSSGFSGLGQGLGALGGGMMNQYFEDQRQQSMIDRMKQMMGGQQQQETAPTIGMQANAAPQAQMPNFGGLLGGPSINNAINPQMFMQQGTPQQQQENLMRALQGGYGGGVATNSPDYATAIDPLSFLRNIGGALRGRIQNISQQQPPWGY